MTTMQTLPADHPMMIAFTAFKSSDRFRNAVKWAVHAEHTEGSLWAAFEEGYRAALDQPPPQPASDAEIEASVKQWMSTIDANIGRVIQMTRLHQQELASRSELDDVRSAMVEVIRSAMTAMMRRAAPPSSGRLREALLNTSWHADGDGRISLFSDDWDKLRKLATEPQDARSVSTDIGVDDYRMRLLDAVEERNEARTQLATAHNETREARKDRDAARKELAEAVRKHNEVRDELAALRANPQPRVAVPKRLQQALSNMQARLKAFDNDLSPIGSSEERRIFMEIIGATESLVEAVESLDAAAQRRVVVEPEPPQPIAELQRLLDEMREARGTFGPFAPGLEQVRAVIDALAKRAGAK